MAPPSPQKCCLEQLYRRKVLLHIGVSTIAGFYFLQVAHTIPHPALSQGEGKLLKASVII